MEDGCSAGAEVAALTPACTCGSRNPDHHARGCTAYVPIDIEAHNDRLRREEPVRAELRVANTAQTLRRRILDEQD